MKNSLVWISAVMILSLFGCGIAEGPSLVSGSKGIIPSLKLPTVAFSGPLSSGMASRYEYIDGPGGALGLDYNGNVLLGFYSDGDITTGTATANGNTDGAILRWGSTGGLPTKIDLSAAGSSQYYGITVADMKVAADNSYYLTGTTSKNFSSSTPAPAIGDQDAYIAKYSANGTLLWARQYGFPSTYSEGNRLAIDANGNVYLVGKAGYLIASNTTNSVSLFFVIKFDASGIRQWVNQSTALTSGGQGYGIDVSPSGNVYISGTSTYNFDLSTDFTSSSIAYVAKYNASGTLVWIKSQGQAANISFVHNGVLFDPSTNSVFVTGATNQTWSNTGASTGSYDYYIAKYTDNGASVSYVNAVQYGVATKMSVGNTLAFDSAGKIIVTGYTGGYVGTDSTAMIGIQDAFVGKFDKNLNRIWVKQVGVPSHSTVASGLVVDGSDNILIGGYSDGSVATGTGNSLGSYDVFVKGFSSSGNPL